MNLQNIRVLVDGYNLELLQGTGIKTYGISLIKALNSFQADINVLYSKEIKLTKNTPVAEVLFFDPNFQKIGLKTKIIAIAKIITRLSFQPQKLNFQNIVIRNPQNIFNSKLLDIVGIISSPFCYQLANFFFQKINLDLTLKSEQKWQIFHATFPLPIRVKGAKKITTIHDLIPLRLPYVTLDDKDFFYRLIKYSIKTSDLIITVSEHSKKDLAKIDFLFNKKSQQKTEQEKVIVLDYVPSTDLQYLFQGAYCFIFPSLYEGFGLPPLEAMSFGCPVITSQVASLPEVCGDAALYIDPYNVEDLSEKLQQILADRDLRDRLSRAGKERAEFFSMSNYQKRLMTAYNQVLSQ